MGRFNRWLLVCFFLAVLYRIYACFQVPLETTDVLRHIGYASHALDNNFAIYKTQAIDFKPEIWTSIGWSNQTYIYPPVTLLFFYIFSIFKAGIFWVKIALSLIELISAYLFYKRISEVAAILFFCAPVSLWYTSHEGQFEAIQTFFIILNAVAIKDKHWRRAGFLFALSLQVKQLGLLIVPWMLYEMWKGRSSESLTSIFGKVVQGVVLGFLPFLGYYLQKPTLLLFPLTSGSSLIYNPFAWNFLNTKLFGWNPQWLIYWNAFFTYALLAVLVSAVIYGWKNKGFVVSVVPIASFLCLIKSLKWGQFWYMIITPGFMFCFSQRKKLISLLLVLYLLQDLRSILLIVGKPFGYLNNQQQIALMESCLFTCNLKPIESPPKIIAPNTN